MVVALEEIVQHDTTVSLAANLPLGKMVSEGKECSVGDP